MDEVFMFFFGIVLSAIITSLIWAEFPVGSWRVPQNCEMVWKNVTLYEKDGAQFYGPKSMKVCIVYEEPVEIRK